VKASVVRQPKKVYCEMIGMGINAITIVRAKEGTYFINNAFITAAIIQR
jgi:hypothetical protein